VSIFLIGLVVLLNIWKGIPISFLTRDITAISGVPFYTGFFSQIGFLLWITTATLCIFSAHISSKSPENIMFKKFLFLFGLLSLFICFDDMFLLHEEVFPFFLGISEIGVFTTYGILVVFLLVKFYPIIIKTDYILLLMAIIFFGLSIVLDLFQIPDLNPYLLEDGVKMFGMVSWFFYFYSSALVIVSSSNSSLRVKKEK
jgi:hypothetical protein